MKTYRFTETVVHELLMGMVLPEEQNGAARQSAKKTVRSIRAALVLYNKPDAATAQLIKQFLCRYHDRVLPVVRDVLAKAVLPQEKIIARDITIKVAA